LIAQIAGWTYLIKLLGRTHAGRFSTSIGTDVIVIMYFTCIMAFIAPLFAVFRGQPSAKRFNIVLSIVGGSLLAGFLWLHVTGKVGRFSKE